MAIDRDLLPGVAFEQAIASELDASDVIIVCWSRASVGSHVVKLEAGEGSRRGILLPVLLDETLPPLEFRSFHAVDLSRRKPDGLHKLADAVERIAQRAPPQITYGASERLDLPTSAAWPHVEGARSRPAIGRWLLAGATSVLVLGTGLWLALGDAPATAPVQQMQLPMALPPLGQQPQAQGVARAIAVPNFIGQQSADVAKIAAAVGLPIRLVDAGGQALIDSSPGIVIRQRPAAGTQLDARQPVQLTLSTQTAEVPSIIGVPLGDALELLAKQGLALGRSVPVYAPKAQAGQVLNQTPQPGARVAAGTRVDVGVASAEPAAQGY